MKDRNLRVFACLAIVVGLLSSGVANASTIELFGDVNSMSDNTAASKQLLLNLLGAVQPFSSRSRSRVIFHLLELSAASMRRCPASPHRCLRQPLMPASCQASICCS